MKKIKVSEQELLAVVINMHRELETIFDLLPKKDTAVENLKKKVLKDIEELLVNGYSLSPKGNNLYDTVFKTSEKVARVS
ncbi:hypothetical protein C4588_03040 [Candidatus Parcubacteria bacterium]|nr:MAG: hypothetical protein C4588_03040 [Candidatus Parcubacteria bacterium]